MNEQTDTSNKPKNKSSITPPVNTERVNNVRAWALTQHAATNHKYGDLPYSTHLEMVYEYAVKYAHLLPEDQRETALCAAWAHDTIEDCRCTYNDVKRECGEDVSEVVFALTNEKGKTRRDRANEKYYEGIRATPPATFVKLCDRLANIKFGKDNKSPMIGAYKIENLHFTSELRGGDFEPMFQEIEELLFN